jgi:hypothetical protein
MTIEFFVLLNLILFIEQKKLHWLGTFLLCVAIYIILILATYQKSQIAILIAAISVSLFLVSAVPNWAVSIGAGAVFFSIYLVEHFINHQWSLLDTLLSIIFRVSASFPFYYIIYPRLKHYGGPEIFRHWLGYHSNYPNDGVIVSSHMYLLQNTGLQGTVSAPAHIIAYSQGGIWASLIALIIITLLIKIVSELGDNLKSPLRFSLYIMGLVMVYYLTQVSIISALILSYGYIWSILPAIVIILLSKILKIIS